MTAAAPREEPESFADFLVGYWRFNYPEQADALTRTGQLRPTARRVADKCIERMRDNLLAGAPFETSMTALEPLWKRAPEP